MTKCFRTLMNAFVANIAHKLKPQILKIIDSNASLKRNLTIWYKFTGKSGKLS